MNKKIRIVILTEDYLLKESLVNKINNNSDYEIIGVFNDGIKCLKYLIDHELHWQLQNGYQHLGLQLI